MTWIRGDKNHPESINDILWDSSKGAGNIGHLHGAYTGAMRVTEKPQSNVSVGFRPEIKGIPRRIGQSEPRFRQGWGHYSPNAKGNVASGRFQKG